MEKQKRILYGGNTVVLKNSNNMNIIVYCLWA